MAGYKASKEEADLCKQGLYRSWKTWKVLKFKNFIFQAC